MLNRLFEVNGEPLKYAGDIWKRIVASVNFFYASINLGLKESSNQPDKRVSLVARKLAL